MDIFDKKTICEICFNYDCSDRGKRNLHWGYDPKVCTNFKKSKDEPSNMRKVERSEADDVEWSTHYDPTKRDD